MVSVGQSAPTFGCSAVVDGSVVELTWKQVHENQVLVLLFDSIESGSDTLDDLVTCGDDADQLERLQANFVVVCGDHVYEVLAWLDRSSRDSGPGRFAFPIIVDSDDHIASMYDMLFTDGRKHWGHCIIDPSGIVRQLSRSAVPVGSSIGELIRCVKAVISSASNKHT